jgi:hypothetical protein
MREDFRTIVVPGYPLPGELDGGGLSPTRVSQATIVLGNKHVASPMTALPYRERQRQDTFVRRDGVTLLIMA